MTIEIFFVIILIVTIVIHEVAHGYAALFLGDTTAQDAGRLTLNPIAHVDFVGTIVIPGLLVLLGSGILFGWAKPVPVNPYNLRHGEYGEAFVAAAGSLTNIGVALLFALVIRFLGSGFDEVTLQIFAIVVYVNLFLGLLNLLPIPPLDGSKVFSLLLPSRMRASVMNSTESLFAQHPIVLLLAVFAVIYLLLDVIVAAVNWVFALFTGLPPLL